MMLVADPAADVDACVVYCSEVPLETTWPRTASYMYTPALYSDVVMSFPHRFLICVSAHVLTDRNVTCIMDVTYRHTHPHPHQQTHTYTHTNTHTHTHTQTQHTHTHTHTHTQTHTHVEYDDDDDDDDI